MLLKHSWLYLLSRLVPGLLSFASLVVFTHLLSPAEYGVYALVLTSVALLKVGCFGWLDLSLTRLYMAAFDDPRSLLCTVLSLFLAIAAATGCLGLLVVAAWPDPASVSVVLIAIPALWAHAWFELNLKFYQSKLLPARYGFMLATRSVVTLVLGYWLVRQGAGYYGPLAGFLAGSLLAGLSAFAADWRSIRPRLERSHVMALAEFGAPLTLVAGLAILTEAAEKFMILQFLGRASLGAFSAAHELTSQSLLLLMMSVNLAGGPLVMRAYETGGDRAADGQIRHNGSMLLAIALPATLGIALLSHNLAYTLLGAAFREDAAALLPWIACAALLTGMRSYFFNLAFQVKKKLKPMMLNSAVSTVATMIFGLLLIPRFGVLGAAWSVLAASAIALTVSICFGRRHMPMNLDWKQVSRIAASTLLMGLVVAAARDLTGAWGLILQVAAGVLAYAICLLAMNAMDLRTHALSLYHSRIG